MVVFVRFMNCVLCGVMIWFVNCFVFKVSVGLGMNRYLVKMMEIMKNRMLLFKEVRSVKILLLVGVSMGLILVRNSLKLWFVSC